LADAKISALTAATALAGTEVLPVVQGGVTVKATVDQILTPAAAKGINFTANTPAAGMTSQLLNWYEEGTWTPSVGGTATYTTQLGTYTRIGKQVTVHGKLKINVMGTGTGFSVEGLPFTSANNGVSASVPIHSWSGLATTPVYAVGYIPPAATTIFLNAITAGSSDTGLLTIQTSGSEIQFSGTYICD
jgi:hypothetical protein